MVENIKRCDHCGKLSRDEDIKEEAFGLFAAYENICESCYIEKEIKAYEGEGYEVIG